MIVSHSPILDLCFAIRDLATKLGDSIADEVEHTDQGKRQSRLEREIRDLANQALSTAAVKDKYPYRARIYVEGSEPIETCNTPDWLVYIDPVDGTSNTARWKQTGARLIGESVACIISVAPCRDNLTFGDFVAAGAIDLRNGQMWYAEHGQGMVTLKPNDGRMYVVEKKRNYDRHAPLLASEFYRLINRATLWLINQPVEWADTASSFMNIFRVILGETDCFFNNVLPEASNEGQRGHELGAISVFMREHQGHAMDTGSKRPLAESPFTFDGMTPVMIGVDQTTVEVYWNMVQENLNRSVALGDDQFTLRQLITKQFHTLGTNRWALRPLAKQ